MHHGINIPKDALAHFNAKSLEVLSLFASAVVPESPRPVEGSINAKIPILDLGVVGEIFWSGKGGNYAVQSDGRVHGFIVKRTYDQFQDFVHLVYKRREINSRYSFETVNDVSFEWFRTSQKGFTMDYATHLVAELNLSARDRMFFFPVLFLEIEGAFSIGQVQFSFFTQDMLNAFQKDGIINGQEAEHYGKKFSGQVMASVAIEGSDTKKGEQVALDACALAVDILKMYSLTIDDPSISCDFGLEAKLSFNPVSSPLVMDINFDDGKIVPKSLRMSLRTHAKPFVINQKYCDGMVASGLGVLDDFVSNPQKNELGSMAMQAIRFMGDAISNRNRYRRIIEIIYYCRIVFNKERK